MTLREADADSERRPTPRIGDSPSARVLVAIAPDENDDVLKIAWVRAESRGLGLTVCSVVDSEELCAEVQPRLAARVQTHLPAEATVDFEVRVGDRADQILASISERETALLVVGEAHKQDGLLARIFWPSVSTRVLRAAGCPILIARYTPGTGRVVAASALDEGLPVLQAAADEVERSGSLVTVLHCLEPMRGSSSVEVPLAVIVPMDELIDETTTRLKRAMSDVALDNAALQVEVGSPPAKIVLPSCRVLRSRLADDVRHRCHDAVDDQVLPTMERTLAAEPTAAARRRVRDARRLRTALTHGSGNVPAIFRGASHGCHPLVGGQALRLAGFLLQHRDHVRHGPLSTWYRRIVRSGGRHELAIDKRGYHIELTPPVEVDVLPGRILSERKTPYR